MFQLLLLLIIQHLFGRFVCQIQIVILLQCWMRMEMVFVVLGVQGRIISVMMALLLEVEVLLLLQRSIVVLEYVPLIVK